MNAIAPIFSEYALLGYVLAVFISVLILIWQGFEQTNFLKGIPALLMATCLSIIAIILPPWWFFISKGLPQEVWSDRMLAASIILDAYPPILGMLMVMIAMGIIIKAPESTEGTNRDKD